MTYSLFLYPSGPAHDADLPQRIVGYLVGIQFIQQQDNASIFDPGDRLLEYINFLGCSPTLRSGDTECQIRIHHFNVVTGMGGESVEAIRFPGCHHVIPNPGNLLQACQLDDPSWACPECGNTGDIKDINWRKSAGFSQLFIEVNSIFPKEALPNDKFLDLLRHYDTADWRWFYSASSF